MQRDLKTGHLSQTAYTQQAVEILTALKKLGEQVMHKFHEITYCEKNVLLIFVHVSYRVISAQTSRGWVSGC